MNTTPLSSGRKHVKRVLLTGLAVLVLAGGGFGGWTWFDTAKSSAPAIRPAIPVHVAAAMTENVPVYVSSLGTVQASNTVTISSRVDGELEKVLFHEGQDVKRGDLLAVVDPRTFQAALDEAEAKTQQDEAALANAKLMLDRFSKLVTQGYSTQEQYDTQQSTVQQLEAAIAQDKAAVSSAQTQLSYTQIMAPLEGRTGIRLVDAGNLVHANATNIVVITQLHPIDVIATLAEGELPSVRDALRAGIVEAIVLSRDGSEQLGVGTLKLINNQIDTQSGTVQLKASFPNQEDKLWPGQFVVLQVRTKVINNAVVVPSGALQRGPDGLFVYVVAADKRAHLRPVTVGQIADGRTIIKKGLAAGEQVVTSGQYRLAPGLTVTTTEDSPAATTGEKS